MKEFFEKDILKKSADNNKSMQNYPACKELNLQMTEKTRTCDKLTLLWSMDGLDPHL